MQIKIYLLCGYASNFLSYGRVWVGFCGRNVGLQPANKIKCQQPNMRWCEIQSTELKVCQSFSKCGKRVCSQRACWYGRRHVTKLHKIWTVEIIAVNELCSQYWVTKWNLQPNNTSNWLTAVSTRSKLICWLCILNDASKIITRSYRNLMRFNYSVKRCLLFELNSQTWRNNAQNLIRFTTISIARRIRFVALWRVRYFAH